jgi:hypothetical protein
MRGRLPKPRFGDKLGTTLTSLWTFVSGLPPKNFDGEGQAMASLERRGNRCRLGRVRAEKKKSGRGPASEWLISHAELTRVRNEGLLPDPRL